MNTIIIIYIEVVGLEKKYKMVTELIKEKKSKLSFVIPCYCSENTIEYVVKKIKNVLDSTEKYEYEIILVNDGSPDNTFEIIKNLAKENHEIIAINLSRNFGQHSALMAGYAYVSGEYIVGMDDDGEHDPKYVFQLLDKLQEGYDYVCAEFEDRKRGLIKTLGSKVNNWMATKLLDKPENAIFSSYYVVRRFVVDEIVKCKNPFPYVGGMIVAITKKLTSVPVKSHERKAGKSGYNLKKSLKLWFNGFTAFSVKPLRVASITGVIMALIGFVYGFFIVIEKIMNPKILVGYSSTMAVMLFVGGMIMLTLGMVGEYIGRIYISINRIPQYVISDMIKNEDE